MSEPFLAEVRMVGFNFAPRGWALCDGQILPINQNQALFSLLGTTYGGDGRTTFALPDLRGRTPIHFGDGNSLGSKSGEESHTLNFSELPRHTHPAKASASDADKTDPDGNTWAARSGGTNFGTRGADKSLSGESIGLTGGGQAHENMQPFTVINFVIALQGIFPSRN